MNELTQEFIRNINILLENGYNPRDVARYAFLFSLDHKIEDRKLEYVVDYIGGMDAGPEFELTREELFEFIKQNLL
ncbi:hypothetical protein DUQ00_22775 [Salmonella bongori]|uniref:Uncharacterized protein n=2 Tax=Salmonella TaxID=590 RepID=A0A750KFB2_SALER|nr:hypothetical protein [Salmonella bongori]EGE4656871.1 hypothetical protein [Salmonella bongori serovar 40:z35:- str. 95-0123]EGE4661028.1 hypothetical protein [Salmonella bongori serovar 48:i:- str. 94-0708]EGS1129242.1 hypothetical protein [Salmonella bongori CFSAN000509]HAC6696716.1 hypothetical protein [Salmonella bongori serovar 44:r:-]AID27286.1 hypothetical protein N643_09060 [Salmonella bongori serovar 48:z41:-- str. RKS3044]